MKLVTTLLTTIILISPALAQAPPEIIDNVGRILSSREITAWSPALFANKDTATEVGKVNGLPVQIDPKLSNRTLVIRNVNSFKMHAGEPREELIPAGSDMAILKW